MTTLPKVTIEMNGKQQEAEILEHSDKKLKIVFPNTTTPYTLTRKDTTVPYRLTLGQIEIICKKV